MSDQVANVEYLWQKCNELMGTSYGFVNKRSINVDYVLNAANRADSDTYLTEPDFKKMLMVLITLQMIS